MPLYLVRDGMNHGAQRQHGPGAVVELSEAEAAGFADKLLRLPDATPSPVQPTVVGAAQSAPAKRKR